MSSERDMRKRVIRALKELDAVSIENGVGVGTPDVNYIGGWIELKSIDKWPTRSGTCLRVEHFTQSQRVWLMRRCLKGGTAYLLIKVANDWLLLEGKIAATFLGKTTRDELMGMSIKVWEDGLNEKELLRCLKKI